MFPSERIARQVLELMPMVEHATDEYQDVILTVSIIMIVVKILMLAYECFKDHQKAASICWNPNWIQKLLLRRVVRKVLVEHGLADKTAKVTAALLQIAKAVTAEDIQAVFREAQGDPEIWVAARAMGIL